MSDAQIAEQRRADNQPSRRDIVAGFAALSVASFGGHAEAATPKKHLRIDVHHHFVPPSYIQQLSAAKVRMVPVVSNWTPQKSLDDMDKGGVTTSMVSITTPGLWFGDAAAASALSRGCNDYGAKLAVESKGRFRLFAAMPLPDIDGTLKEIAYALDVLKADGVALFTSYGDKWLGDPLFDPVFAELNRRKAVVYTHPTNPACCTNLIPGVVADSEVEYGADTTRALANFVFSGSSQRYPDIRMIFSHAGGAMPFLIRRFVKDASTVAKLKQIVPNGFMPEAKRFYYDIAQSTLRPPMLALKAVAPMSHILFGTDFPYLTAAEHVEELKTCGVYTAAELRAIDENAAKFLPSFQA